MARSERTDFDGARMRLRTRVRVAWLKFLDRVKPRHGIGGPSLRVVTATSAEVARIKQILCDHPPATEWLYIDREPEDTYTGYCEQCPKCGEIRQVPQ